MIPWLSMTGIAVEAIGAAVLAWEFWRPLFPPPAEHRADPFWAIRLPRLEMWKRVPSGTWLDKSGELTRQVEAAIEWIGKTDGELKGIGEWSENIRNWAEHVDEWVATASGHLRELFAAAQVRRRSGVIGSVILGVGLILQGMGLAASV